MLWTAVVLVLATLLGVAAWWLGSGRWTAVPKVTGLDEAAAQQVVRDADLTPQVDRRFDNTVPAGTVLSISPPEGQDQVRGSRVNLVVSRGRPVVPKLSAGLGVTEAERFITEAGLKPSRDDNANTYSDQVEKGKLVTTNPGPGTELQVGSPVVLVLSKGPAPKPVPDVTGKTKDEAFQLLQQQGLQPVEGPQEFSPQVDAGRVVRTDPPAGSVIPAGDSTQVSVVLSNAVTVPEVRGMPVSAARGALQGLGLQVEVQQFFQGQDTPVLDQSVPAGSRVQPGSKVVITAF